MGLQQDVDAARARLAALEYSLKEEREAARKAVKPVWTFTIEPTEQNDYWRQLWDTTIRLYTLRGTIVNADELKAVGKDISGGGMTYMFNTGTGKFVCPIGGGQVFVVDRHWTYGSDEKRRIADEDAAEVWKTLGAFVTRHPQGGDVTGIITAQRLFMDRS